MGVEEFLSGIWDNLNDRLLSGIPDAFVAIIGGVIFLLVALLVIMLIRRVLKGIFGRMPMNKMVGDLIVKAIYALMLFTIMVAFLEMIGLGQIALALGAAIAFMALAIGLAMNNVLGDFVAGGFLLGEKDIGPGFEVEAAGVKGTVVEIDMRKTRIKAEDGVLHVIPNKAVESATWKVFKRPPEEKKKIF